MIQKTQGQNNKNILTFVRDQQSMKQDLSLQNIWQQNDKMVRHNTLYTPRQLKLILKRYDITWWILKNAIKEKLVWEFVHQINQIILVSHKSMNHKLSMKMSLPHLCEGFQFESAPVAQYTKKEMKSTIEQMKITSEYAPFVITEILYFQANESGYQYVLVHSIIDHERTNQLHRTLYSFSQQKKIAQENYARMEAFWCTTRR